MIQSSEADHMLEKKWNIYNGFGRAILVGILGTGITSCTYKPQPIKEISFYVEDPEPYQSSIETYIINNKNSAKRALLNIFRREHPRVYGNGNPEIECWDRVCVMTKITKEGEYCVKKGWQKTFDLNLNTILNINKISSGLGYLISYTTTSGEQKEINTERNEVADILWRYFCKKCQSNK